MSITMNTKELNDMFEKAKKYQTEVCEKFVRARNPFELRYFVIGKHQDRIQQFKQLLCEMDAKYQALTQAEFGIRKKDLEKEEFKIQMVKEPKNRFDEIHNEKLQIEIEKCEYDKKITQLSMLGALKEVFNFVEILEGEFSDLIGKTEEETLLFETDYWKKRFAKQVEIDMLTEGHIGKGNLDVLMNMPKQMQEETLVLASQRLKEHEELLLTADKLFKQQQSLSYPQKTMIEAPPEYLPLKLRKDAPNDYSEDRIVNMDIVEIMIATLHRNKDETWLSEQFYIPTGKNYIKHWVICDREDMVGEWRNRVVMDALSLGCTHLFFVDDDLIVDNGALQKLYKHNLDVVGGFYCKKTPVPECASMRKIGDSKEPIPIDATGLLEADWSLTAGLTLYNMSVFKKIQYPWFLTTPKGTEDTYLSARLREAGIKSFIDCDVRADHVDKNNKKVYLSRGIIKDWEAK